MKSDSNDSKNTACKPEDKRVDLPRATNPPLASDVVVLLDDGVSGDTFFQTELPRPPLRTRRRLATQATWGAVILLSAIIARSQAEERISFYYGIAIAILSIYPLIRWAGKMDYNYPFFEVFMAMHLPSYALPLIIGENQARVFPPEVVGRTALCVLFFQITALVVFMTYRVQPKKTRFWTKPVLHSFKPQVLSTALVLTTAYVLVVNYIWTPPSSLVGILRAISFAATTSALFIAMMLRGRGMLPQRDMGIVLVSLVIQFLVLSSGLILRSGASLIIIAMIGYFFGSRRVPWVAAILCLGIFAMLHTGKFQMREKYWFGNYEQSIGLSDLPAFYEEWFFAAASTMANPEKTGNSSLIERSSLIQMLSLVVDESPNRRPFLEGKTYGFVLGQFVPRIIWPGKPRGHIATYTLAIYYGLQDEDATESTTIAFGLLPEAYANFGMLGSVLLGVVLGGAYKLFNRWSLHSPVFSYPGFLVILFTAWSFQMEMTMAVWLGSLFQAVVALLGGLYATSRFLRMN